MKGDFDCGFLCLFTADGFFFTEKVIKYSISLKKKKKRKHRENR